jgi:nucleotide-binding universal stress UspA family protein
VTPLCRRVLVGVDGSTESVEAARQAARLAAPDGRLTLLAAWAVPPPTLGVVSPDLSRELDVNVYRATAERALEDAEAAIAAVRTASSKIVCGVASTALVNEIQEQRATLVVVGSHRQGRLRGALTGSTATELIHRAPCPVLVARRADDDFPRRVVVGVDGSPESAAAYTIACELAERFGSELLPLVAHGGKDVDREAVAAITNGDHEDFAEEPVHALVSASADADLVVVGSRGLRGLKAAGSVSERVAHQARCSTLIFHAPAARRGGER